MTPEREKEIREWVNPIVRMDEYDNEGKMLDDCLEEIDSLRSRLAYLKELEEWMKAVDTFPDVRFANQITRLEDGEGGHYFRISLTESHATEWKSFNGDGNTLESALRQALDKAKKEG